MFIKILIKNSLTGLLLSIFLVWILINIDDCLKDIFIFIPIFNLHFNIIIPDDILKNITQIMTVLIGILGVIFGLSNTTFVSMIAAKYTNINNKIIDELFNIKVINYYFRVFTLIISCSLLFLSLIIFGYKPTYISFIIYICINIITLFTFIYFGINVFVYFNASNLAKNILSSCNQAIEKVVNCNKYLLNNDKGQQLIRIIINKINIVKSIIEESKELQLKNTALDQIFYNLLLFSLHYNKRKHFIPSNKEWHIKVQKYKSWDEATSSEYQVYNSFSTSLPPKIIDDYFFIEKLIIDIQFNLLKILDKTSDYINLISKHDVFIKSISHHCELEIFDFFFNNLEEMVKEKISKIENIEEKIQLISIYRYLLIQYIVGFNLYITDIINYQNIKKLAELIHNFKSLDIDIYIPYQIRVWIDNYQLNLMNERELLNTIKTPLFYTEYLLSYKLQFIFKTHIEQIIEKIYTRINSFDKFLITSKHNVEALFFATESLEFYGKINYSFLIIDEKISKDINQLNLKKEEEFIFENKEQLLQNNDNFKENLINRIWNYGKYCVFFKDDKLPDFFGNFYNFISNDFLKKILNKDALNLEIYVRDFCFFNITYFERLKERFDKTRIEQTAIKLFPIIIDLFELSAISIIVFKVTENKKIEKEFFKFFNDFFNNYESYEYNFWKTLIYIYEFYNKPAYSLSTNSNIKSNDRQLALIDYLKENNFAYIDENSTYMQHYITDIQDVFIQSIVGQISDFGISSSFISNTLSEFFIEYFLRTRIALKDLNIKETNYGSVLRRYLDKN